MKILVVGGAGYLGGALTEVIHEYVHQDNVTVYDNLLYTDMYIKDLNFVYGDIRDRANLAVEIEKNDIIIWLAAIVGDGACQLNPELTIATNEESIKWFSENYPNKRIIFMSTCSVYGAQHDILTEESNTNPLSLYAATKLKAESYLKNCNALIFRLGTLFGTNDHFDRIRFDLVINVLTLKACTDKKITVFGGDQYRPVVHVLDIANTIGANLYCNNIGIYNIAHINVRVSDLAELIKVNFPNCEIIKSNISFEDARNYKVSWTKALKELRVYNSSNISFGINQLKALIESNRIKNLKNS